LTTLFDRDKITVVIRARSSMVEQWPFKPPLVGKYQKRKKTTQKSIEKVQYFIAQKITFS